jgi:hypothetical protein
MSVAEVNHDIPTRRYGSCVPCVERPLVGKNFLHVAVWSEQPCVRPSCAAHMTAGHNALRGSGPGEKLAFEMRWH